MHYDADSLPKTYAEMEADEIVRRVKSKTLAMQAHAIALSELKGRDIDIALLPPKPSESQEIPIPSLLRGELGLAKTYWGFLMIPSIIFKLTLMNVTSAALWAVLMLLFVVYAIPHVSRGVPRC